MTTPGREQMDALVIERHGPLNDLAPRRVAVPRPGPGDVLVRVQAAAVNPSDVVSAEGRFPNAPLPRILGRDFAGTVVGGAPELEGLPVWGSGGDLGISRDGTHAQYLVLPENAVSRRPANLSVEQAASVGVPFITAWAAIVEAGRLERDEIALVSGAAGAVGTAAIEIARARGARVVALVLDENEAERIDRSKVEGVALSSRNDTVAVVQAASRGRGVNVALNGVGAPIFPALFAALATGGRLVVYSAAAGRETTLDLFDLYRRWIEIHGVNTALLGAVECARILTLLAPLFETGEVRPLPAIRTVPLREAARAYADVAHGSPEKIVLIP